MTSTSRIAIDSEVRAQIEASAVDKGDGLFHIKCSDIRRFLVKKGKFMDHLK